MIKNACFHASITQDVLMIMNYIFSGWICAKGQFSINLIKLWNFLHPELIYFKPIRSCNRCYKQYLF